jgi:benzil reductase ((S)-benzoin forming)
MSSTVTVLTGATRGLGRALAQELLAQGHHVVSLSRKPIDGLQSEAHAKGGKLTQIDIDLSDMALLPMAAQSMVQALKGAQKVRIIHNAGIVNPVMPAEHLTDLDAIRSGFDVNIVAPIYLTGHFLTHTAKALDRRIMLISSGAGRKGSHSWGVYCATKAAMDRYAEVVKAEAPANVRVCSMAPGVIDTPMQAHLRAIPLEQFPTRARFEDMHRQGVLVSADQTAAHLLLLIERDDFGHLAIDDVRNHAF